MKKLLTKFVSLILIFSMLFSFAINFFVKNETYALSSSYTQYVKSGISSFPESYQKQLAYLKYLHPNWEFKAYYTGISWSELTSSSAENKCLRNTIYKGSTTYVDPTGLCSAGHNGDPEFYCASAAMVNYYLDPRNFLGEAMVFQFLDLSNGDGVSKSVVESAVSGTYLASYVDDIMTAASEAGISPLHIVATIFQELGTGSSTPKAISGTVSGYEGYYNFYNYGATDSSDGTAVTKGLEKAKEMGWNSPSKALINGAKTVLASGYVSVGQTTKYFYKFDVVGNEILTESMGSKTYSIGNFYSHQYMTNLRDPSSQAGTLYDIYAESKILDEHLTFTIPVYNDMPSSAVSIPSKYTSGDLYYVNTLKNGGLSVRSSAGGTKIGTIYKNAKVLMVEKGDIWSKVKVITATSFSNSTWNYEEKTVYLATEYLTKVGTDLVGDHRSEVDMGSGNSVYGSAEFKISGSNALMTPATTLSTITTKYSGATLKNSSGSSITTANYLISTGDVITVNGTSYTCIKYGDINGDGYVDTGDTLLAKQVVMSVKTVSGIYKTAADVNKDGYIDTGDTLALKKQVMKTSAIGL